MESEAVYGQTSAPVGESSRWYPEDVEAIREREYPLLANTTYLDHAGTTLYAKSLIEDFSGEMTANLFGNPHSASASSQLSTRRVDDVRVRALKFFNADPDEFDLVFVANATAGIKLVADALRDCQDGGFRYGYHLESHSSLVGVRELARRGHQCLVTHEDVSNFISDVAASQDRGNCPPTLFAYPAQSNMTGKRQPRTWCRDLRRSCHSAGGRSNVFSLLDAASLAATSPLDLSNASCAPDFTVLSFYKIFGFPDLGALIVRKDAGHIFSYRRFFGGGTVDMIISLGEQWHSKKQSSIHDQIEDGTLPFHSIIALDSALRVHKRLYGSMENVSKHTNFLATTLRNQLSSLTHANGQKVCELYSGNVLNPAIPQGPVVSFNMRNNRGEWIGKSDVEKLASVKDIQIRSGPVCNPGGTAYYLGLDSEEMKRNYAAGQRCGDDHDVMGGKPTGILRASLGAMSSMKDVQMFVDFVDEYYVDKASTLPSPTLVLPTEAHSEPRRFHIEMMSTFPIKSCAAFNVPEGMPWQIKPEGLAWDREWCLIHQGTGVVLSQKKYPRMALIRPHLDLQRRILRITLNDTETLDPDYIEVSLDRDGSDLTSTPICENSTKKSSTVCGDQIIVQAYLSPSISSFFSDFLGVPCTLARFPPQLSRRSYGTMTPNIDYDRTYHTMPGSFPEFLPEPLPLPMAQEKKPILLANESPILLVSRSSVNRLNETIKFNSNGNGAEKTGRKAVPADIFRANIVVAEEIHPSSSIPDEQPYIEDTWSALDIAGHTFHVLGSCQRCHMVCVDQRTAEKNEDPYLALSRSRKTNGKVWFGRHMALGPEEDGSAGVELMVGDTVMPSLE